MRREQGAELAHLVPEDRQVPVVDVEIVVLDVREHDPGEMQARVEGGALRLGQQLAVLGGDSLALRQDRRLRTCDVLAGGEPPDVRPDRHDRERRVVDPRAVVVVEDADPAGEVEPRILRLVEVGEPARPAVALGEAGA